MSVGPGLGIGSTLPLTEYLYFLINLSGTYSFGKHEEPQEDSTVSRKLTESGANTTISLAYYIAPASTSITLGFRYQYLYINYSDDTVYSKDEGMSFYGITLSAVYSF
jgi:hypothetical protein